MRFIIIPMLLLALPAYAAPWDVDEAASSLTFSGKQANASFTGEFGEFTPTIDFDPAAPEKGSITVDVKMASARIAEDKEQNDALPGEDWFFTRQFPSATFQSKTIRKTADNQYAADGTLTIRGISQPVTLPFTLSNEGGLTRADGEIILLRNAFGLGGKQWQDEKWIAYPVTVHFTITATPAK